MLSVIFISHRSIDKAIADALLDFLVGTGIPKEAVFCSSLPGNDVREKISGEVRESMKNSCINIAILSRDYYSSTYCLNEAGVIWFCDNIPSIMIALPEITDSDMQGFLNNDYKLRRLDNEDDIAHIHDAVAEAVKIQTEKFEVILREARKLKGRYLSIIDGRENSPLVSTPETVDLTEITTDDERIVLYCLLEKNVRKISTYDVSLWVNENEIDDINIDNAFDLLTSSGFGKEYQGRFEIGIETFRHFSSIRNDYLKKLSPFLDKHKYPRIMEFINLWNSGKTDDYLKLFCAFICDERISRLEITQKFHKKISQWEANNELDSTLERNYHKCVNEFSEYGFAYDNRNFSQLILFPSVKELLFNPPQKYAAEFARVKDKYKVELPF